jgi:hypothetical protein
MARRRDVARCAFERANLIIGASDMVSGDQSNHKIQEPSKQRPQGKFNQEFGTQNCFSGE